MVVIKRSVPNGKCCISLVVILFGHRQRKYFSFGSCRLNYCCLFSFSRKDSMFVDFGLVLHRASFSSGDKYSVLSWTAIFSSAVLFCCASSVASISMAISFTLMVLNPKKVVVELDCEGVDVRHLPWCLTYVILFFFLLSAVLERSVINCHFPAWISCFVHLPVIFISLLSTPGAHKCLNYVFSLLAPVMLYFMKEDTWQGSLV